VLDRVAVTKPDETLTDIARGYNIKAYGVNEDAALPEDSGTVFVR
jgi:hypothetical protein